MAKRAKAVEAAAKPAGEWKALKEGEKNPPGWKTCPKCHVAVKGPKTKVCPKCNADFPAAKKYKPTFVKHKPAANGAGVDTIASIKAAQQLIHSAGGVDNAVAIVKAMTAVPF